MDTIKIYRNDDNSYVLYEKGALLKDANDEVLEGFLGLENFLDPQYSKKNPAMIADTAAGYGTWYCALNGGAAILSGDSGGLPCRGSDRN